jgi:DNA mismatch repair protein MutL
MSRINVLDDNTANRIAAGEVVERPASVVKELVENAIDAGAKRITVELGEGGKQLIRVTDDGCGMDADDAVLCLQRFATSKIAAAADLAEIATLGFRGEALPSIAAVSRLRMTTREPEADEGTEVIVNGGVMADLHAVGCPPGTMIEVRDLFFNTPARLKFLKVTNTERSHCLEWVQRLALAHPDIAFRVIHDASTCFVSPATGDMLPILATMYGSSASRDFIPVSYESPDIRIAGHLSNPRLTRANRTHQHFFINGRLIRSRMMSHGLTLAYGGLLPTGRQPICAITFDMMPRLVDPNAHPTKIEVRFSRPWEVHHLLEQAVVEALRSANLIGEATFQRPAPTTDEDWDLRVGQERSAPAGTPAAERPQRQTRAPAPWPKVGEEGPRLGWRPSPFADVIDEHEEGLEVHARPIADPPQAPRLPVREAPRHRLEEARVLGQLRDTYILAEAPDALLLINQHRASEVALAQRLRGQSAGRLGRSQRLTVPVSVELPTRESSVVGSSLDVFLTLGFEIEPFGGTAWLIRAIPTFLEGRNYEEVFRGLAEQLADEDLPPSLDQRMDLAVATAACRAAVKAGERLNQREMEDLVKALAAAGSPGLCPHGDPLIIALRHEELDRRFER